VNETDRRTAHMRCVTLLAYVTLGQLSLPSLKGGYNKLPALVPWAKTVCVRLHRVTSNIGK